MKRLAGLVIILALALAACGTGLASQGTRIVIRIHYSHYDPRSISVPAGQPITFVIVNEDPIDHEWIVGDEALHALHRTGTELHHDSRPTEISIDALTTRETTVTFAAPTTLTYVCHLPGHEAYGMVGVLTVTPGS